MLPRSSTRRWATWEAGYRHAFEAAHPKPLYQDPDYLDGFRYGLAELERSTV